MVIDNLDCISIAVFPNETDTLLIIDPDTVLSFSRSLQRFKPIGRWHTEIFKQPRIVQHSEFSARDNLNICGQLP
jgi:hypothetical protein